uniref:PAS domain-containing protein n=1 Tax=Chenopodium quinoa TaxID=63459 RepID=A0A803MBI2_CHEQI
MESQLELVIKQSVDAHYSNWVYEALDELPCNFTLTDPCISGNPIVFASWGFLEMFGYSRDEVIGRNGRMFQGKGTNRGTVMEIREAIREERAIQVSLLNYHKNGTPFWILFCMSPVFSGEDGRVIHFVAVQVPISRKSLRSGSGHGRSDFCLCEDGVKSREFLLGSCRREVCSDSVSELSHSATFDSFFDLDVGIEVEEFCEASELDKQKATTSISNILSVLTQYSALRGKSISEKSCSVEGKNILNSALLTSLGCDRREVLGRKHRFLSGSDTDPSTLLQVFPHRTRKDTTPFWNLLHLSPVRNASGKVAYFVEVHMEDCINQDGQTLIPKLRHLGAIAAVKVTVRSATMGLGSSRR